MEAGATSSAPGGSGILIVNTTTRGCVPLLGFSSICPTLEGTISWGIRWLTQLFTMRAIFK